MQIRGEGRYNGSGQSGWFLKDLAMRVEVESSGKIDYEMVRNNNDYFEDGRPLNTNFNVILLILLQLQIKHTKISNHNWFLSHGWTFKMYYSNLEFY